MMKLPSLPRRRSRGAGSGLHLECACPASSPRYSGSLSSFLLDPLADALESRGSAYNRNRSVVVSECKNLALELDFALLPGKQPGSTFRLEVRTSKLYTYYLVSDWW